MKKSFWVSLFCLGLLVACTSKEMPDVDNPSQLASDCQILSADSSVHEIDKGKWPDSVKKLDPVTVTREVNGVYITTFASTGVGSRGYVVAMMKPGDTDHYKISDTPYPKIYRFDFKP